MPGKTPPARLDALAVAVAAGQSVRAAARSLGVKESTACNWSGSVEFKARVEKIRSETVSQARSALSHGAVEAVETLVELLGATHDDDTRQKAAKEILASLLSVREHHDAMIRLAALEARFSDQTTPISR
jgi:transposase